MANLKEYNKKRDFSKTSEPIGMKKTSSKKISSIKNSTNEVIPSHKKIQNKKTQNKQSKNKKTLSKNTHHKTFKFVIQHHLARQDHYDLRLEYDGVYKSFAVPKGPSFNPQDKRLAVQVEDHPLSYGNFEGVIPAGQYGAGPVMLFDRGTLEYKIKPNFKKGPLKFILKGKRLKGAWTLVPFKEDNWLLIKEQDEYVLKNDIQKYKTSIKTGRTFDEIKGLKSTIDITHPQKIIISKGKVTKGQIADYYELVADRMLPFLENRLISTVRSPDGKSKFYMKHLNSQTSAIGKKKIINKEEQESDYYYIKNRDGLLYEVNMNSYEFHIWGSKQNRLSHPDLLVFDLDPDEGMNIKKVRQGVKDLKSILDELKLRSYLKTSGGKGYHIVIPLSCPSWHILETIASQIAELMVQKWPTKYTTNIRKENRVGKIFIDYFRNKKGATSVAPYSIRLKNNAPISCPISWSSLDKIKPQDITIKNIKEQLKKKDPWFNFFDDINKI